MNWGRKNTTSSGLSSISHVFPISWLSKFKQINSKSKSQPAKSKRKTKPNSSLRPTIPLSFRGTQIYYNGDVAGDDDDAYLQFSLRREDFEGKRSRGVAKTVWYDSDDELEFPITGHRSCRPSTQNFGGEDREENVLGTPPKKNREERKVTHRKSRKKDRIWQEVSSDSGRESIKIGQTSNRALEMNNLDLESEATTEDEYSSFSDSSSRKSYYITFSNSKNIERNGTIGEVDQEFKALNLKKSDQNLEEEKEYKVDLNRETVKEPKIKDRWSKRERQRKSIYLRGAKQSCKYSPRTALKIENCKIRALEDMKKAKTKKKERKVEGIPSLESFAVEKCSFNPQKDFRDSMVEMIMENGIRQSEELENLLACYLTLNSDEYHDLIVKVFREIWFDLKK